MENVQLLAFGQNLMPEGESVCEATLIPQEARIEEKKAEAPRYQSSFFFLFFFHKCHVVNRLVSIVTQSFCRLIHLQSSNV